MMNRSGRIIRSAPKAASVTIDITAVPAGGLLGQLLCGLAGLLDGGIGGNALKTALNDVANAILDIVT
jgi:hypothetical protein